MTLALLVRVQTGDVKKNHNNILLSKELKTQDHPRIFIIQWPSVLLRNIVDLHDR